MTQAHRLNGPLGVCFPDWDDLNHYLEWFELKNYGLNNTTVRLESEMSGLD